MTLFRYVCLLRGVNVGSSNRISMVKLREILEDLHLAEIATYIQSGNIAFSSLEQSKSSLASLISGALEQHGVSAPAIVLNVTELTDIIQSNPYPDAVSVPKSLHVFLLTSEPDRKDMQELAEYCTSPEKISLCSSGDVYYVYLHAPNGIGRSKVVSKMERVLNMSVTGRNWRTMNEILRLADLPVV